MGRLELINRSSSRRIEDRTPRITRYDTSSHRPQGRTRVDSLREEDTGALVRRESLDDAAYTIQPSDSRRQTSTTYYVQKGYDGNDRFTRPQPKYASSVISSTDTVTSAFNNLDLADTESIISSSTVQSYGYAGSQAPSIAHALEQGSYNVASPRAVSPNRSIKGTPGNREKIDSTYVVRRDDYKNFFRVGRVFATLWTDAVGDSEKLNPTFVTPVIYGEKVFTKIRRFVVVRQGDRSVSCLPVTSYNGDAINKKGIRREEHGFICSRPTPPKPLPGMLPEALQVCLSKGAPSLSDSSLVNYGKTYNVETNVKVKDIGELDSASKRILRRYWKQVLSDDQGQDSEGSRSRDELNGIGGASSPYSGNPQAPFLPMSAYPNVSTYPNQRHSGRAYGSTFQNMQGSPAFPPQGFNNYAPSNYDTMSNATSDTGFNSMYPNPGSTYSSASRYPTSYPQPPQGNPPSPYRAQDRFSDAASMYSAAGSEYSYASNNNQRAAKLYYDQTRRSYANSPYAGGGGGMVHAEAQPVDPYWGYRDGDPGVGLGINGMGGMGDDDIDLQSVCSGSTVRAGGGGGGSRKGRERDGRGRRRRDRSP